MSHTFTQLTDHVVFSTKERVELISPGLRARLYPYILTTINNQRGFARQIGGTADHVHILFDLHQSVALADCVRDIKSASSGWIHDTFPELRDFAWQEGYGAFSVSASAIPRVKSYIENQERHHRVRSFQDEFIALLDRHGIEYDPRHVWD